VTDSPETRYTRSADGTNLAYQVSGDGPLDVVFFNWAPPIDFMSEDAGFLRVGRGLDTFSRSLWFDLRGMAASEGDPQDSVAGNLYDGDLTALLDAGGFERPAMIANGLSGLAAIHYSVTHPDSTCKWVSAGWPPVDEGPSMVCEE
jgi:pimeloyl-ACP methyl ester carboxylesterase